MTDVDTLRDYDNLCEEIRSLYHFPAQSVFTLKWIDDENDPCMLTNEAELREALRLYKLSKEAFLTLHELSELGNATCAYCQDRIWGLGQQGYKCNACKLLIHKRCTAAVDHRCGEREMLISDGITNNAFNASVSFLLSLSHQRPFISPCSTLSILHSTDLKKEGLLDIVNSYWVNGVSGLSG
ncbi:unnamed protein product [Dibothriocephalus latus]|uniref:Phorbol-ester/DAG-type domain-containing protein n=1 Tax=Dibothriocephalus latus TaxID=60516 RepID=A0A3P7L0L0_DIBLA|nr:unnamed protein product [Dibothriocephalus latus]